MASTSTGYNKSIITKEQPSSSGQVMSFTSGCILNIQNGAIYRVKSGGEMEIESGSTINVESGGSLSVNSGAIFKVGLTNQSSAVTAMPRDGISAMSTAVAVATNYLMAGPPKAGIRKTIITYSTLAATIRGASLAASGIYFGSASTNHAIVITPTSLQQKVGVVVDLIGQSSLQWGVNCNSTAYIVFSTACS